MTLSDVQIKKGWKVTRLANVLDTVIDYRGKTPKKLGGSWSENGIPALSAKNIKSGKIVNPISINHVDDDLYKKWMKEELKAEDILLTSEAPLGESYLIKKTDPKFCLSQRLFAIRTKDISSKFLYYYLNSKEGQEELQSRATGTTVQGIRQTELLKVEIPLPSPYEQKSIGETLFAYDELIENNEKRIKILDSMIQKLYREWFVKNNSSDKQVRLDSITIIHRGKSYSSEDIKNEKGIPFVNLKCINRHGGFRYDGLKSYSGTYKDSHVVKNGDIVIAVTDMTQERMLVARVARIPVLDGGFGVISMDLVKVEPKENTDKTWLYCFLRYSGFGDNLKKSANGVNVLHLNPARISEYKLSVPSTEKQKSFSVLVENMLLLRERLSVKNRNLQQARDFLIPQLVGGKLKIKNI